MKRLVRVSECLGVYYMWDARCSKSVYWHVGRAPQIAHLTRCVAWRTEMCWKRDLAVKVTGLSLRWRLLSRKSETCPYGMVYFCASHYSYSEGAITVSSVYLIFFVFFFISVFEFSILNRLAI